MEIINTKECTAVFIGHNECYSISSKDVELAIEDLINKGVTTFLSGGQGGLTGCVLFVSIALNSNIHRLKTASLFRI